MNGGFSSGVDYFVSGVDERERTLGFTEKRINSMGKHGKNEIWTFVGGGRKGEKKRRKLVSGQKKNGSELVTWMCQEGGRPREEMG